MTRKKSRPKPRYFSTSVPVGTTLEHIRQMLVRYKADRLMIYQDSQKGHVGVEFVWQGAAIRLNVSADKILARLEGCSGISKQQRSPEHAMKIGLRLILHYLENAFEMADWEIMSPGEIFMPYLVLPGGRKTLRDVFLDAAGMIKLEALQALPKPN